MSKETVKIARRKFFRVQYGGINSSKKTILGKAATSFSDGVNEHINNLHLNNHEIFYKPNMSVGFIDAINDTAEKLYKHNKQLSYSSKNIEIYNSRLASLRVSFGGEFKYWLDFKPFVGHKEGRVISIPIINNDRLSELINNGRLRKGIIISDGYIQFTFESIIELPKVPKNIVGVDIGMGILFAVSDGDIIGNGYIGLIKECSKINPESKKHKEQINKMKRYIDSCVKKLMSKNIDCLMLENSQKFHDELVAKSRREGRGEMQALNDLWLTGYIWESLEMACKQKHVWMFSVKAEYTSKICSWCEQHPYGMNKNNTFICSNPECKRTTSNSHHNASRNIERRGRNKYISRLTGEVLPARYKEAFSRKTSASH